MNREESPDNGEPKSGSYGMKFCMHESDGQVYTSYPPQSKCTKCGVFYRSEVNDGPVCVTSHRIIYDSRDPV